MSATNTYTDKQNQEWLTVDKILFRFFFLYLGLYIALRENDTFPFMRMLLRKPMEAMDNFYLWIGKNIYNIQKEIPTGITGSGDMTVDWIAISFILAIAIIGTIIWSIVDRKRKNYTTLLYWISVFVRYTVALMMLGYGFAKLYKSQFPYPHLGRLMQDYGDSSPMGLVWTFIGYSYGYNVFIGIAEVAAALLLFRRTVVIGALITFATVANVMAINYFFDVPVKLLSTHLGIMTLFLLAPYARNLWRFFLGLKTERIVKQKMPVFNPEWLKWVFIGLKTFIIGFTAYNFITWGIFSSKPSAREQYKKEKFYGMYEVDEFYKNGEELTHYKDSVRWDKFSLSYPGYSTVRKMNGDRIPFYSEADSLLDRIKLTDRNDSTKVYHLDYEIKDSIMDFTIIMEQDTLTGKARQRTEKDFLLMNRKFHWISEEPYNR